jgi:hypothetical protein
MTKFSKEFTKKKLNTVKQELNAVVNRYLEDYFSDQKSKEGGTWSQIYSYTYYGLFFRICSSHGKKGYYRALKLLDLIKSASSVIGVAVSVYDNSCDKNALTGNELNTRIGNYLFQYIELSEEEQQSIGKENLGIIVSPVPLDIMYRRLRLQLVADAVDDLRCCIPQSFSTPFN